MPIGELNIRDSIAGSVGLLGFARGLDEVGPEICAVMG